MENIICPSCGFVSHFVSSDGSYIIYRCERCGYVFQVKIR